jgi:hypothetical protein
MSDESPTIPSFIFRILDFSMGYGRFKLKNPSARSLAGRVVMTHRFQTAAASPRPAAGQAALIPPMGICMAHISYFLKMSRAFRLELKDLIRSLQGTPSPPPFGRAIAKTFSTAA